MDSPFSALQLINIFFTEEVHRCNLWRCITPMFIHILLNMKFKFKVERDGNREDVRFMLSSFV